MRRRSAFLVLALGTIALGLWVHRGGGGLGPVLRDMVGDGLWAMMMAWWFGMVLPDARLPVRSVGALAVCFVVEFSQLVRGPLIDSVRDTTAGRLILGSGFDPRDLLSYALGVLTATILEGVARRSDVRVG